MKILYLIFIFQTVHITAQELSNPTNEILEKVRKCSGFRNISEGAALDLSYNPHITTRCPALTEFQKSINPYERCIARKTAMHKGYLVEKNWTELIFGSGCHDYGRKELKKCLDNPETRKSLIIKSCNRYLNSAASDGQSLPSHLAAGSNAGQALYGLHNHKLRPTQPHQPTVKHSDDCDLD